MQKFPRSRQAGTLVSAFVAAFAQQVTGQTLELLHAFHNSDGANPRARLMQSSSGDFYGTTRNGGTNGQNYGTVFRISPTGAFTNLLTFGYTNGALPQAGLAEGLDGFLYGTTAGGAVVNGGTVFKMSTNGSLTVLVDFHDVLGSVPCAELRLGSDGNFYGTTRYDGPNLRGTVFRMTPSGNLTTLHAFTGGDNGAEPTAALLEGKDGNFYGTTAGGAATFNDVATIFRIAPNGDFTTLVSLAARGPVSRLMQGINGDFYGTSFGGARGYGRVFTMTAAGAVTTLCSFNSYGSSIGYEPDGGVVQGANGDLYGITIFGGTNGGAGTAFGLAPNGALSALAPFKNTNGAYPYDGLLLGRDGNLYGTTSQGGPFGYGTVFRIVMPVSLGAIRTHNELVLRWPTNAVGFTLQVATNLVPPVDWVDSTNLPLTVGAEFLVTNDVSGPNRFFRMKK